MTYRSRHLKPHLRRRRNCSLCGSPAHTRPQCPQYDPFRGPPPAAALDKSKAAAGAPPDVDLFPDDPTEADRLATGFELLGEEYGV